MKRQTIIAMIAGGAAAAIALTAAVRMNSRPAYAMTMDEAAQTAAGLVPGSAEHVSTDSDDDEFASFDYLDEATGKMYRVSVDLVKGEVTGVREYNVSGELVGDTARNEEGFISAEDAKSIALARVEGATRDHINEFELDREDRDDDDRAEYEGEIHFNGVEYEFEIDALTGEITEWEREYRNDDRDDDDRDHDRHEDRDNEDDDDDRTQTPAPTAAPTTAPTTESSVMQAPVASSAAQSTATRGFLTADEAKAIALAKVPGATYAHIDDFELDDSEYEIEIKYNGVEYEIEINGYTGQITEFEADSDDDSDGDDHEDGYDDDHDDDHDDD